MKKYLEILLKLPTYVKVVVLVVLLLAAVEWKIGILHPKRSWKSGGTTVTYSDGTFRVKPSWGVAVSYDFDHFYALYSAFGEHYGVKGLKRITNVRWKGAMKDYAFVAPPWRSVGDTITNLVVEEGVTYIGKGIFAQDFTGLKSITIPNSVTEIGELAFNNCIGLTSIRIPESVTKIGMFALPSGHGSNGFGYTRARRLHYIISLNPIPPELDIQLVCVEAVLYVPEGSVDAYRAAAGWNGFKHIKPIDDEAAIYGPPSEELLNCLCLGIGWCGGYDGDYCDQDRLTEWFKSGWLVHLMLILVIYGFAYWLYVLLEFIMRKKHYVESKKRKILLMALMPVFTIVMLLLWGCGWCVIETKQCSGHEYTRLPNYNRDGAIIFGGIYLAFTALFYQVFRKKIKRQVTLVILATLHIIIFANLMINGGL
jgi:hypothetical protein